MKNVDINSHLQQQIDALDKEISPSRDLWKGIERAIEHRAQQTPAKNGKHQRYMPLAWAASVVLAVLVTWQWPANQAEMSALPTSVVAMQQEFNQNRELLMVSLGRPDLNALPQELQSQFTQIASARKSLQESLVKDPNNADLLNLLQWLHQQELDLLQQLYQPQWQTI